MLTFRQFIIENFEVNKLTHLEHAEDYIIHGGDEGVAHAADNLEDAHKFLTGGKSKSKITTKYDGCVHGSTLLINCYGCLEPISAIVDNNSVDVVLGYDLTTNTPIWTEITNRFHTTSEKSWITLTTTEGDLTITDDHLVLTSDGYKHGQQLTCDDMLVDFSFEDQQPSSPLRIVDIQKLDIKHHCYDITTTTSNFAVVMNSHIIVVHNSPSVVYGIHPETKKFFVASKSAFNKDPKINYTDEDIERNHGHAPGLVSKLKSGLQHLPKIMPKNSKGEHEGVYQGDFMYDKPDVYQEGNKTKFTPNTITYGVDKDSEQGKRIARSQIGFVTHTKYTGRTLADMKAGFDVDHSKFTQHSDVNHINPEVQHIDPARYTKSLQDAYTMHRDAAAEAYRSMAPETLERAKAHNDVIKPYINQTVRDGTIPHNEGYASFLKARHKKDVESVKTPAAKERKTAAHQKLLDDTQGENGKEFEKVFKLHHHLQQAKNAIVQGLSNPTEFDHSVGGKQVKPEGFVSIRGGMPTKLVDRQEFSRNNFANSTAARTNKSSLTEQFADDDADQSFKKPHVLAFGRMNPPTTGHGALVDKVKELAKQHNADHSVVLSSSQDPEKNPLPPDVKVKHAKRMFPGTNIEAADEKHPTIIHQAQRLHQSGVDHLVVVGGSDRVEDFHKLLHKYNGPGKEYNFKKISVVSAGQRDPDAEDVSGMSASKMRSHALAHRFSEFKKGIPSHVSDDHAKELYNDVQQHMDVPIGPDTNHATLAKHAKRQDVIGTKARAEVERRAQEKASKPTKTSTKKINKGPSDEQPTS